MAKGSIRDAKLGTFFGTAPKGPIRDRYIKFVYTGEPDVETRYREIMFVGDFGVGKSRALLDSIMLTLVNYPGAKTALARDTYKNIVRTVRPMIEKVWEAAFESGFLKAYWNDGLIVAENGSELHLLGLDHPDADKKLKSSEFVRTFVEQAELISEEKWALLMMRTARQSGVVHRDLGVPATSYIKGAANWDTGDNWIKRRFMGRAVKLADQVYETRIKSKRTGKYLYRLLITGRAEENQSLPEQYFEMLELAGDEYTSQYFSGTWAQKKGLVVPAYDAARHTVGRIPYEGSHPVLVGIDHGVRHPTVAIFALAGEDGVLQVVDEYVAAGNSASDNAYNIVRTVLRLYEAGHREFTFVLDRATRQRERDLGSVWDDYYEVFTEWMPHGAKWTMLEGNSNVEYRASKMNQLFRENKIIISAAECPNLMQMLGGFTWDDEKKDKAPDTDVFDAFGYLVAAAPMRVGRLKLSSKELRGRISRRRVHLV